MNEQFFSIFFIGILVITGIMFIYIILMIFSPKARGKMMSKQIKAGRYAVDESKEDLKTISDTMANATKDGIKTTANAIKEGFTQSKIFCKHCGNEIDDDSKFCKKCGKEQ